MSRKVYSSITIFVANEHLKRVQCPTPKHISSSYYGMICVFYLTLIFLKHPPSILIIHPQPTVCHLPGGYSLKTEGSLSLT